MTSRFRPVTTACSSSSRELRRRSMERMVSALGRATRWTSRPSRNGLAESSRACSMTSAADTAVGARSASAQRPSFSMRIGTGSYRVRSRFAKTAAADASDTSCSPERPP